MRPPDRRNRMISRNLPHITETESGRPLEAAPVRELITQRLYLLPTFRWRLA